MHARIIAPVAGDAPNCAAIGFFVRRLDGVIQFGGSSAGACTFPSSDLIRGA
jgi:hypothetical protein